MIELSEITKTYGNGAVTTPVLKGVSFVVDPGEYVAIMGTSGTGKSTLMNIIGLLDRASSGRYLLDGTDVTELDDEQLSRLRNKKLGFVFQQFHLLERTSARKNVLLPLIYADKYPGEIGVSHLDALSDEGDKYGIMMTPTIVINDKVVSIGKVPSEDDIEKMIKKEME